MEASAGIEIEAASAEDAAEILTLQKAAFQTEVELYGEAFVPALHQSVDDVKADFKKRIPFKAVDRATGRIVGSVRAVVDEGGTCRIGMLMTSPAFRRRGIASALMRRVEKEFPQAKRFELFTGGRSFGNIRLYESLGYKEFKRESIFPGGPEMAFMAKQAQA